jgi:cytochrome c oxidase assembly factor CtaG
VSILLTTFFSDLAPFGWRQFGATDLDFGGILILAAGLLYGLGVFRVNRGPTGTKWSFKRVVAFYLGLVVTFIAVEAFIGVYDDILYYDHMIQHLMLIMIAAPLFAMGAPVELLDRATTGRAHVIVTKALRSKIAEFFGHPIVGFVTYAVLIPVCHLTSFYNYALTHEQVHDLEHLLFLVAGYLFWRHVVGIEPSRHPLHPGVRLLYLALAVPVDTFTGLAIASASHELFPAYNQIVRTWGPSRLIDLHIGGTIMWVACDTLMLLAMIPVAIHWMRYEEQRAREIDKILDEGGLPSSM